MIQRQVPIVKKIPKSVETSQAQFITIEMKGHVLVVQQYRRPWSSQRYKHSQRIVDVTVVIPREEPTIQSVQKMVWTLSVSISIETCVCR